MKTEEDGITEFLILIIYLMTAYMRKILFLISWKDYFLNFFYSLQLHYGFIII